MVQRDRAALFAGWTLDRRRVGRIGRSRSLPGAHRRRRRDTAPGDRQLASPLSSPLPPTSAFRLPTPPPQGRRLGCTKAPFTAESHTANRTHFFPLRSTGTSKRWLPKGGSPVAGTTFLPV